ncbi:MAG: BMP family ABC transporter substrate-binding protein [Candidatus Eisenbacteria bacterium]|nr:BMP family ABC transporter substrate-binding protein [Candidatus Eisenbacteria bacterium]
MNVRRPVAAALALLALVPFAAGCGKSSSSGAGAPGGAAGPMQVGLVFDIGGRGDKSFNDAAYAGLEAAQKELGIRYTTLETSEGADREAQMRQLANGPAKLIFGVGFLFSDDIRALAKEFPDKEFACVDYTLNPDDTLPPNLVALEFREEEGSYLVGALAALTSKTHKVGFVGGMSIPLIKKFEAGYVAGVKAADPKCEVLVKYAGNTGNAFKDPTKGKELALAEYHAGADVIYHASGSTGLGVFEAARALHKLAIGVDSDQYDEAPGAILTSMVKRVDTAVLETIRAAKENRFEGGVRTFGLADHGVTWVYDDRNKALIPDAVKARVDSLQARIVRGEIVVPTTP